MARYQLITLVDITRTNPSRSETDQKKIAQQSNFNSLVQAIGLRSNVSWARDPKIHSGRLPDGIDGKANHWIWEFDCERDEVFLINDDPVGLLKADIHGVPIIDNLDNTVELSPAVFQSSGEKQNIWFSII